MADPFEAAPPLLNAVGVCGAREGRSDRLRVMALAEVARRREPAHPATFTIGIERAAPHLRDVANLAAEPVGRAAPIFRALLAAACVAVACVAPSFKRTRRTGRENEETDRCELPSGVGQA